MMEHLRCAVGFDADSSYNPVYEVVIKHFGVLAWNVKFTTWIFHNKDEAGLCLNDFMLSIFNDVSFVKHAIECPQN